MHTNRRSRGACVCERARACTHQAPSVRACWQIATFYANRAACHAKLRDHESVVDDCTAALERQPEYTKALMRRALAREALDLPSEARPPGIEPKPSRPISPRGLRFDAGRQALEDAKRAAELEPSSAETSAAVRRLEAAA